MVQDFSDLFQTKALLAVNAIPGGSIDGKIEFVANVLGIAGFTLSLGLLMIGTLYQRGRRRPATKADLESLSCAVVDMIGDRVANQLSNAAVGQVNKASAFISGQEADTMDFVRSDLTAAIAAITANQSDQSRAATAALINGETEQAERIFETLAYKKEGVDTVAAAEALHLKAVLQSIRDPEGALQPCLLAVQINPGDASGWRRLGHLYLRLGRVQDARQAFETAMLTQGSEITVDTDDTRSHLVPYMR